MMVFIIDWRCLSPMVSKILLIGFVFIGVFTSVSFPESLRRRYAKNKTLRYLIGTLFIPTRKDHKILLTDPSTGFLHISTFGSLTDSRMDILDESLQKYSEQHTAPESDVLQLINRDTYLNLLMPRMLSGHLQGRVLSMISHLLKPRIILEIGTFTAYSAICLAEGLAPGGKLITIEKNEELADRIKKNIGAAGMSDRIELVIGNAEEAILKLNYDFDLVFIDADKERYSKYFDLVIDKVRPGGLILADNVLWSGKVLDSNPDKDTRAITEFNKKVHTDPRVENVLLPIRDGIMLMRKK